MSCLARFVTGALAGMAAGYGTLAVVPTEGVDQTARALLAVALTATVAFAVVRWTRPR